MPVDGVRWRSTVFDLMRPRDQKARTTNIELFFDLVYVFAVTQLSSRLIDHVTWHGAVDDALLLGLVWQAWAYTTWMTNWLDPERLPVRTCLLLLAAASLIMSAGIPEAFGSRGELVAVAYAVMQIGRSTFITLTIGGPVLRRNFQRITCWCVVSCTSAVVGGLVDGTGRELLWLGAVAVDVVGAVVGFWTPGLGRSRTTEWTVEGGHFADRCQAFLLIALGEGVVRIGESLADTAHIGATTIGTFVAAFAGTALLWWVYFDRSAEAATGVIAGSDDPGRLSRTAYHLLHPVMIAGIVVTAAADERIVHHPGQAVDAATAWTVLGGTALYLLGHSLFKVAIWRDVPVTRLLALVALAVLGAVATHLTAWQLGGLGDLILLALVVSDRVLLGGRRAMPA